MIITAVQEPAHGALVKDNSPAVTDAANLLQAEMVSINNDEEIDDNTKLAIEGCVSATHHLNSHCGWCGCLASVCVQAALTLGCCQHGSC